MIANNIDTIVTEAITSLCKRFIVYQGLWKWVFITKENFRRSRYRRDKFYRIFEHEIYIAEMGITTSFGGIIFNACISIYLFVALANAPSFVILTTLPNMHGEISMLKMRSISLNL